MSEPSRPIVRELKILAVLWKKDVVAAKEVQELINARKLKVIQPF
jgi:hypothetical protein